MGIISIPVLLTLAVLSLLSSAGASMYGKHKEVEIAKMQIDAAKTARGMQAKVDKARQERETRASATAAQKIVENKRDIIKFESGIRSKESKEQLALQALLTPTPQADMTSLAMQALASAAPQFQNPGAIAGEAPGNSLSDRFSRLMATFQS